jgi:hypothetical protein
MAQDAKVEIAGAAHLSREAVKAAKKRHHDLQDNSEASEDEAKDGAASQGG